MDDQVSRINKKRGRPKSSSQSDSEISCSCIICEEDNLDTTYQCFLCSSIIHQSCCLYDIQDQYRCHFCQSKLYLF